MSEVKKSKTQNVVVSMEITDALGKIAKENKIKMVDLTNAALLLAIESDDIGKIIDRARGVALEKKSNKIVLSKMSDEAKVKIAAIIEEEKSKGIL